MRKIVNYLVSSWQELRKVHWPSRQTAIRDTIYVVAALIVSTALIGLVDFGLSQLTQLVVTK